MPPCLCPSMHVKHEKLYNQDISVSSGKRKGPTPTNTAAVHLMLLLQYAVMSPKTKTLKKNPMKVTFGCEERHAAGTKGSLNWPLALR